jgi:hypothetical protein
MIPAKEIILDSQKDEMGQRLSELLKAKRGTGFYRGLKSSIISDLKADGYITFSTHYTRCHLTKVGESLIYQVPNNKQGHLKKFRGKKIRVLCIGNFVSSNREVMAGPWSEDES